MGDGRQVIRHASGHARKQSCVLHEVQGDRRSVIVDTADDGPAASGSERRLSRFDCICLTGSWVLCSRRDRRRQVV